MKSVSSSFIVQCLLNVLKQSGVEKNRVLGYIFVEISVK